MRKNPPEKVSEDKVVFDVSEIEPILSGPSLHLKPWKPVSIKLSTGETMLIREAKLEEAPTLLNYLKKFLDLDYDFYDIVGARVYSEVLGWYRNRLKDPYTLLGIVDGKVVGFANGRLLNKDINISLHTMAFRRGGRIGAVMYYVKTHYAFEILENKEFWATYESYNGWKRWGIGMAQPSYPWPEYQHELGGARVYYVTKEYWDAVVKKYISDMVGAEFEPVTEELLKRNENIYMPETLEE
ncbi:MAG TPA: N-acetyltransferase [Caldisericia bacterium]|nr:N-acetyltransferase [Caldisericia bacterium]HQL66056.1 N-acetyltransferase [Caldisericia bacterium]HQO99394.1 N-acetyltransferase [Caldisericia bacterium]